MKQSSSSHWTAALVAVLAATSTVSTKRKVTGVGVLTGELLEMKTCDDFVDGSSIFFHPNFTQTRSPDGQVVFSLTFNNKRPLTRIAKLVLAMDYCTEGVSKACEHFQTWRFGSESCTVWESKALFWSNFKDSITPRWSCPFLKGDFQLTNTTLNLDFLDKLPFQIAGKTWSLTFDIFGAHDDRWACGFGRFKFFRMRQL